MADLDPQVTAALELTRLGRKEHELRARRYDRSYEIYRASAPRPRGVEAWQSRLRVPYGMQVIDTALVNLVSGNPRIVVKPRHPDSEMGAKALQFALDYYVDQDHLVNKQPRFVQQGLIYGSTAAKVHWLYRESNRMIRVWRPDPNDPSKQNAVMERVQTVERDGPTFEPWNIYHVYWDPGAVDVESARYVVLQSYVSKDDLRRLAYDADTGEGLYHNVEELIASGSAPQPKSTSQDRATGVSTNDRFTGKFLLEEIWSYDNTVTVIGNRQILMRKQDNPYWHGRKPIVISQVRPDLFELQGIAETELIDHLQQAQWTLQNMTIDNLHLTVMRGITYREGGVTDPNQLELRPRFKWPVSDHDDIRPFEVAPISTDVYTERQHLLADMQLVTGINPYVSGSDMSNVDQNTATGVTALQDVASRLLRFKASQIQNQGYQPAYEMWGDMIQQFLDHDLVLKIVDDSGDDQWVSVSPQDVAGNYDYSIDGSEESLSRQQERAEATALLNAFAPFVQLGAVNPAPLIEKVANAYNFPNPEELLAHPPQQSAAAPFNQPPGQQPTGGTNIQTMQTLLGGQQLGAQAQNAINH